MSGYRVEFSDDARHTLRKLRDAKLQKRLISEAEELGRNPRHPGCVKLSGNSNFWRVRVGDYRIVYEILDDVLMIVVIRIAHRREVYR